jgi:hypothetical protein
METSSNDFLGSTTLYNPEDLSMNDLHFILVLNFNKWREFSIYVQMSATIKFCACVQRMFASFSLGLVG